MSRPGGLLSAPVVAGAVAGAAGAPAARAARAAALTAGRWPGDTREDHRHALVEARDGGLRHLTGIGVRLGRERWRGRHRSGGTRRPGGGDGRRDRRCLDDAARGAACGRVVRRVGVGRARRDDQRG